MNKNKPERTLCESANLHSLSWKSTAKFTLGAFYTVGIKDPLAFRPELCDSIKGGRIEAIL